MKTFKGVATPIRDHKVLHFIPIFMAISPRQTTRLLQPNYYKRQHLFSGVFDVLI